MFHSSLNMRKCRLHPQHFYILFLKHLLELPIYAHSILLSKIIETFLAIKCILNKEAAEGEVSSALKCTHGTIFSTSWWKMPKVSFRSTKSACRF